MDATRSLTVRRLFHAVSPVKVPFGSYVERAALAHENVEAPWDIVCW